MEADSDCGDIPEAAHELDGSSFNEESGEHHTWKVLCQHPGCTARVQKPAVLCKIHAGAPLGPRELPPWMNVCMHPDCGARVRKPAILCKRHGGGRSCAEPDCNRAAAPKSDTCPKHGGGRRCDTPGCEKAVMYASRMCRGHGGGPRCQEPTCGMGALSGKPFCARHLQVDGLPVSLCQHDKCRRTTLGPTHNFCGFHMPEKPCKEPRCPRDVARPDVYCPDHQQGGEARESAQQGGEDDPSIDDGAHDIPPRKKKVRRKCQFEGCQRIPSSFVNFCPMHGGAARRHRACEHASGCKRHASRGSALCKFHVSAQ